MGHDDQGPGRRGRLGQWLAWLLRDDADWVLGDLEERRRNRRGIGRGLAQARDVISVAIWALGRRRTEHGGVGMDGWTRRARAGAFLEAVRQDLRHTLAGLRRDVGFTSVTIVTLAIGIGANAAVFSVVQSTLLKPLPYEDPDGLAMVWTEIPAQGIHEATSSYANVQDWKTQSRVFEDLATYDPATRTLTDGDWPEQIATANVSANLFSVLGVTPLIGRAFSFEDEQQRVSVALLSYDLWQRRFGGSLGVLDRTIEVNQTSFEVVGVMPESFDANTQLWLPQTVLAGWDQSVVQRGTDSWRVVGRLAAGVSLERARSDMSEIADRLEREHPAANAGLDINVVPLFDHMTGYSFRVALWTLFGAVSFVLLIACANTAHLILARGVKRTQEFSLRVALGATTLRLIRLTLTESLVISLAAGVVGLLLAVVGLRVLMTAAPANMPRLDEVSMDVPVLIYAIAVSLATGVLFGIVPVLSRFRGDLYEGLREGRGSAQGSRGHRVRHVLVVTQFALAITLVFGANLLIRSFMHVQSVDPGFQSENVLMANLSVESASERVAFYQQVVENVRTIPGVRATGIVEDLFISGAPNRSITVEGPVSLKPVFEELRIDAIAGEFFQSIGVPLREGRAFSASDGAEAAPVAIINETMAKRLWPGATAVGKRFRTEGAQSAAPWIEVVGVVGDMRRQGLERPPISQAFRPYEQATSRGMNLLVLTDGPVPGLPDALRTKVSEIDRTVPLYRITTVAEALDRYLIQRRFQTMLLGLFSAIALVLAAIGIYGLVQHSVSQRTREMGVRMALGAASSGIVIMVLRQGFTLALIGLAAGIGLALLLSKAVGALLFGVVASDLTNAVVTSGILLITTLVACYLPARRAARIDPVAALRDW